MKKNVDNNNQIRVAQIMGKLWAGGVEAVVFNYYREIDKTKVQFDFFYDADSTVDPPKELIDMGARFYKIPPYQKLPVYLTTLRGFFRENNYKIVHSHINTLSVFPLFAAWQEQVPVRIAHNHSVPGGNEFSRNTLKKILRMFAKLFPTDYFACSEKAGRWMFGDKEFDKGNVLVVKNAIDFEKFRPSNEEVKLNKKRLGLTGKFVVCHVGRFTHAKNHDFLIKVFSEICKLNDNAKLLLVGDGELHCKITSIIKDYNIEDKVVMIGQVSNPEKYYRIADVIILPSLFEGLSLTTIESQIAGVPIVISESIPEEAIISNGCTYLSLNESAMTWAKTAIEASKIKVVLNAKAQEYDIKERAKLLTNWYIQHSERMKREKSNA